MYQAEGFSFETEEEAQLAKKEADGVRAIKTQVNLADEDSVLALYNGLVEKHLFKTEVGLRYLFELQDYLLNVLNVPEDRLIPIPAWNGGSSPLAKGTEPKPKAVTEQPEGQTQKRQDSAVQSKQKDYKKPFYVTLFLTIVLAICIVGMFIITELTGNNTNIANYENEIIDRYESWEAELNERESELDEREAALNGTDTGTNGQE